MTEQEAGGKELSCRGEEKSPVQTNFPGSVWKITSCNDPLHKFRLACAHNTLLEGINAHLRFRELKKVEVVRQSYCSQPIRKATGYAGNRTQTGT